MCNLCILASYKRKIDEESDYVKELVRLAGDGIERYAKTNRQVGGYLWQVSAYNDLLGRLSSKESAAWQVCQGVVKCLDELEYYPDEIPIPI